MRRFGFLLPLCFTIALSTLPSIAEVSPSDRVSVAAQGLLDRLTPEERVGQLFMVTFRGSDLEQGEAIRDLIVRHHVSGVLLKASNDNFVAAPNTVAEARSLVESLQQLEYQASQETTLVDPVSGEERFAANIPLFIAIKQEGNGAPFSEILSGLTTLPSEMAIGATWDPELSRATGEVLGQELSVIGLNLLLGPSLDILDDPRLSGPGDLGVRSFGGDPYWVSLMATSFIEGVHQGSNGGVAVVAKHFPGLGAIDRPIEDEVSSVRKSLGELAQIELAPFFAVTGEPPGEDPAVADGLLVSHIRYQGFQGNIRQPTRPVSLDPDALGQLMAFEGLSVWRKAGGVMMSDSLGSRAIRRFYESSGSTFRGTTVARDAFIAGNDLLLFSEFQSDDDPDGMMALEATLSFFVRKYQEDAVFAQRVDDSALRILELKMRIFGESFLTAPALPPESELEKIGAGKAVTLQVAQEAATLLSPSPEEILARVAGPPQFSEKIVFVTDVRLSAQCQACRPQPGVPLTALQDTVLRLYGLSAAGQVGGGNLTSLSMADLALYLGEQPPQNFNLPLETAESVGEAIRGADWLVFMALKSTPDVYGSNALKLLLDRQPAIMRDKRLVVFAMDVPYDLDATEISKVDLYYALYAKTTPFVEVAARLLFQELLASGAPPVQVPGIGYDLIERTSPNPSQVISLKILAGEGEEGTPSTPEGYFVGDLVHLETGMIQDYNGNPVPDGTPVEFILSYAGETIPATLMATTLQSVARTSFSLDRLGVLTIQARSNRAQISEILQISVQEGQPAIVRLITPTALPTKTPFPTRTPIPPTPTEKPEAQSEHPTNSPDAGIGLAHLALGLLGIASLAGAGYLTALQRAAIHRLRIRVATRCALLTVIGGLTFYNYLALGLPGSHVLLEKLGVFSGLALGSVGGGLGFAGAWLWLRHDWRGSGQGS